MYSCDHSHVCSAKKLNGRRNISSFIDDLQQSLFKRIPTGQKSQTPLNKIRRPGCGCKLHFPSLKQALRGITAVATRKRNTGYINRWKKKPWTVLLMMQNRWVPITKPGPKNENKATEDTKVKRKQFVHVAALAHCQRAHQTWAEQQGPRVNNEYCT